MVELAVQMQIKERLEMEKRLQKVAKTMDHLERAKRQEEAPLIEEAFQKRLEEEKILHEQEQLVCLYCHFVAYRMLMMMGFNILTFIEFQLGRERLSLASNIMRATCWRKIGFLDCWSIRYVCYLQLHSTCVTVLLIALVLCWRAL
jgi:hypothetical protein